jgi:hypothetical protein
MLVSPNPEYDRCISESQILILQEQFGVALRTHRFEIPESIAESMIAVQTQNTDSVLLRTIRKYVETETGKVMRQTRVNRDLTPRQVLEETRRVLFMGNLQSPVLPSSGMGTSEVVVEFFHLGRPVTFPQLQQEYLNRRMDPDPYALVRVNADDIEFGRVHRNGVSWQDASGKWWSLCFYSDLATDIVQLVQTEGIWSADWCFGGIRAIGP